MNNRMKALLILIILLPYILPFSENKMVDLVLQKSDGQKEQSTNDILDARDELSRYFTPPVDTYSPQLPIKFIPAEAQKILYQNHWLCEFNYNKNNDLFLNHPITIYKISLSVHTSDG